MKQNWNFRSRGNFHFIEIKLPVVGDFKKKKIGKFFRMNTGLDNKYISIIRSVKKEKDGYSISLNRVKVKIYMQRMKNDFGIYAQLFLGDSVNAFFIKGWKNTGRFFYLSIIFWKSKKLIECVKKFFFIKFNIFRFRRNLSFYLTSF
jgi:hypothetical protein